VESMQIFLMHHATNSKRLSVVKDIYLFYSENQDELTKLKRKIPQVYANWMNQMLDVEFDEKFVQQ